MSFKKLGLQGLSICLILLSWHLLSLHYSPIVVPPLNSLLESLTQIVTAKSFITTVLISLSRLALGLVLGLVIGTLLGLAMGLSPLASTLFSPPLGLIQTMPPVSWILLALVWFGFGGRPAVFIVTLSTLPVMALNIAGGIKAVDNKLLQMAKAYRFGKGKVLRHVILPSIWSHAQSGVKIALGLGWKIAVMAEVLTTTDGIGGAIKTARLNLEPETIIAWSIVVMALFYLTSLATGPLFRRTHHD